MEKTLAKELRSWRIARGLTREALAEMTGVSKRMIEHYEYGEKNINKAGSMSLYRLASALGCRMEDLLEFSEEDRPALLERRPTGHGDVKEAR